LRWLDVLGVTRGSFEDHDLELVGELDPGELPAFLGTGEKRQADLQGLLTMVRFAGNTDTCRRRLLAEHFELPSPPEPCPGCDVCRDADAYLAESHRPRSLSRPVERGSEGASYARGDWVEVGRHLGQVVRVEGRGTRQVLWVESATDLKQRRVDPRRQKVRKVRG
ncbi:MAG: RecQ family zinc-binding domain-containing protein, partial [Planctomycetes bacterium]|nr:RecQ family zinc-binding domain-containing protein [Planctomycetota bacterium]